MHLEVKRLTEKYHATKMFLPPFVVEFLDRAKPLNV